MIVNDENKLIENNYKLVWSVVNKFHYLKEEKEDLFQSGCIGLIIAAKKFDASRGNAFSTFAIPYILGEIKNYLRNKNQIKVSKKILSTQKQIKNILNEDSNISINDLSSKLNLSYEEIVLSYNVNNKIVSLENTLFEDQKSSLADLKIACNQYDFDNSLFEIKDLYNKFSRTERKIFYYRFYYGLNQSETAKILNVSQSKISRIEKKVIDKFKEYYKLN